MHSLGATVTSSLHPLYNNTDCFLFHPLYHPFLFIPPLALSISWYLYYFFLENGNSSRVSHYNTKVLISHIYHLYNMALRPSLITRGISTSGPSDTGSPARDDAKKNMLKAMRPLPTQHCWDIYFDRSVLLFMGCVDSVGYWIEYNC